MLGLLGLRRRKAAKKGNQDVLDIPTLAGLLNPDVATSLVNLYQVPDDVTNAVIQLLPVGTRFALIGAELAEPDSIVAGRQKIRLTPRCYEVIEYLAEHADSDPNFEDWTRTEDDHVSAAGPESK